MFEYERDQIRKTYQLCRIGFFLLTIALLPACILSLLFMVGFLGDRQLLNQITGSPWSQWVSNVSVWGSLVGAMMLWGRWDHKSWQRRTGLLLVMCIVDLVVWFMDRGENQPGNPDWFRANLGQALGWAEFALLASLSGDYLVHLGLTQAEDSAKSTRSLAATGAVVWMLKFCELTNWDGGWPLRQRNRNMHGMLLLILGSELIWTITLIQVTALVIAALRQTNRTLAEMERDDHDHELLPFSAESPRQDMLSTAQSQGFDREL